MKVQENFALIRVLLLMTFLWMPGLMICAQSASSYVGSQTRTHLNDGVILELLPLRQVKEFREVCPSRLLTVRVYVLQSHRTPVARASQLGWAKFLPRPEQHQGGLILVKVVRRWRRDGPQSILEILHSLRASLPLRTVIGFHPRPCHKVLPEPRSNFRPGFQQRYARVGTDQRLRFGRSRIPLESRTAISNGILE